MHHRVLVRKPNVATGKERSGDQEADQEDEPEQG
jgi:hypothetical protein